MATAPGSRCIQCHTRIRHATWIMDSAGNRLVGDVRLSHRILSRPLSIALIVLGMTLLPWMLVLATSLPATATAQHWPLAWIGLTPWKRLGWSAPAS